MKIVNTAYGSRLKAQRKTPSAFCPSPSAKKLFIMQLTKAEEQVMQILWKMGEGIVRDIRDNFSDPKPARNTVSTVLRVM